MLITVIWKTKNELLIMLMNMNEIFQTCPRIYENAKLWYVHCFPLRFSFYFTSVFYVSVHITKDEQQTEAETGTRALNRSNDGHINREFLINPSLYSTSVARRYSFNKRSPQLHE